MQLPASPPAEESSDNDFSMSVAFRRKKLLSDIYSLGCFYGEEQAGNDFTVRATL